MDSVEGLGSRFWISVPMAVAAAINPASLPERDARPRASLSILLVELNSKTVFPCQAHNFRMPVN